MRTETGTRSAASPPQTQGSEESKGLTGTSNKDLLGIITDGSSSLTDKIVAAKKLVSRLQAGQPGQTGQAGQPQQPSGQQRANPSDSACGSGGGAGDGTSGAADAGGGDLLSMLEELLKTLSDPNADAGAKQAAIDKFAKSAGGTTEGAADAGGSPSGTKAMSPA